MRWKEIKETPQIVGDEDWGLGNLKTNLAKSASFLQTNPTIIEDFPTAILYHQGGNSGGQLGLVSKRDQKLEYYVHYETGNITKLGSCATQIKLWRSPFITVKYMAGTVFDNYLLKKFDTLVSDSYHTIAGKSFWVTQLSGYGNRKTVGFLIGNEINTYDSSKEGIDEWLASIGGWGDKKGFRNIRCFISNLDIKE